MTSVSSAKHQIVRLTLAAAALLAATIGAISATTAPAAADLPCMTRTMPSIERAKINFAGQCERPWDDQVRDQCTWLPNSDHRYRGWACHTFSASNLADQRPDTPERLNVAPYRQHSDLVRLDWDAVQSANLYYIYRDGRHVSTEYTSHTVVPDVDGAVYSVVAEGRNGVRSAPARVDNPPPFGWDRLTGLNVRYPTDSSDPRYRFIWSLASSSDGYNIYINGNYHTTETGAFYPRTILTCDDFDTEQVTLQVGAFRGDYYSPLSQPYDIRVDC